MSETILKIRAYLVENFGNCPTCMRQSLMAALGSWAVFAAVHAASPGTLSLMFFGITAVALTSLWLMHIAIYSIRSANWAKNRSVTETGSPVLPNRREILSVALRAVAVGLIVSMPTALAARCANLCTKNDDCGGSENGWCCKNVAPVNAGYVCNQCRAC